MRYPLGFELRVPEHCLSRWVGSIEGASERRGTGTDQLRNLLCVALQILRCSRSGIIRGGAHNRLGDQASVLSI